MDTGNKIAVSMRFSTEGLALMDGLAKKLGLNRTSVAEMAIRRLAEREGVRIDVPKVDIPEEKKDRDREALSE